VPQGKVRILHSTAPYRVPAPRPGQKLLSHDGFVPTPAPEGPDGFEQLVLEIAQTEERLALMKDRLALLRARTKKKRNSMATLERIRPEPVKVRR
jgi:hypothetical protein